MLLGSLRAQWEAAMTNNTIPHSRVCTCCGDLLRVRFDRRRFLHLTVGALAAVPSLALGAYGNYDAMLLTCIDPRFPEPTIKYMEGRDMVGKYSQFSIAGASIGVVAPAFKTWAPAFWDNLAASMELHNIPKVIAMNHRDCGAAKIAYGADKVANPQIETETHKAALIEFRKQVAEKQPKLQVELGLMALDGKVEMFS
jgi:carbonic anhydrase